MADFHIKDGTPQFWTSDSIWVRQDPTPVGWTVNTWDPPGDFQAPIKDSSVDNFVWVRVSREGSITANPAPPKLHLWAGRGGPHFIANSLNVTANDAVPTDPLHWSDISDNRVVRINHINDAIPTVDLQTDDPPDGPEPACRWYKFIWEYDRIPPPSEPWHPCLLAFVEAAEDSNQGGNVPGDDNLAQRNIQVVGAKKNKTIKRRVILGNRYSKESRMSVMVQKEGKSDVHLRFLKPKDVIQRIPFSAKLPFKPRLPRAAFRNRLPSSVGVPLIRDLPPSFGLKPLPRKTLALTTPDSGFSLPVHLGETIEMEVQITPKAKGWLSVHVSQSLGNGAVVGGVTIKMFVTD